jgi:predicted phosphodiesterase
MLIGPVMRLPAFTAELSDEVAMRVACLYDIHGNLPALEAVLADVREARVDRIVIGGDVLPGPMPRESLDLLYSLDIPAHFIIGNGDREAAGAARSTVSPVIPESFRQAMTWNAAQLQPRDLEAIDAWPLTIQTRIDGIGEVLFCHATPRNDAAIFVKTTAEEKLLPIFEPLGVPLVVCGHTHMQFDRMIGTTRVVNAGSVGMPFDEPGAYWALLGPGVALRRTEYDYEAAAARVRRTAYPLAEQCATGNILRPPSMESMLDGLSKGEL